YSYEENFPGRVRRFLREGERDGRCSPDLRRSHRLRRAGRSADPGERNHRVAAHSRHRRSRQSRFRSRQTRRDRKSTRLNSSHSLSLHDALPIYIHTKKTSQGAFVDFFAKASEMADVLLICGDLTDYGAPEEARILAKEITASLRIPGIGVLGNHDFEAGKQGEIGRAHV